ncbi:MAG TPA: tripartite tricarboxylate transporter substrate binding protein [Burkholderiaceae bacterium]|nr:tripartite tricarboxylate transporter substrate binding protein [Burkholderiaceae bacterium]
MKSLFKPVVTAAFASCVAFGAPATAAAEDAFPSKLINFVIPYAAGGPTDAMARTLAVALRENLGQSVIVENKAGAGANIGAEYVARAKPDGYTIMLGTPAPLAINVSLFRKLKYDPLRDFAPVIKIGTLPNVLAVHPDVPANDMKELIAYAKANPDKLTFASSGSGASSHLAGVLFNNMAGTDMLHVPYKGTGPALTDLLGGQVTMTFTDVLTALPHIRTGKLKAIGVTSANRSRVLPDVPTLAEQGLTGYDSSVFFGVVAPAGTPEPVIARLNEAFRAALLDPKVKELLDSQGLEAPESQTPEALGEFMKTEVAKWAEVVKSSGAQVD